MLIELDVNGNQLCIDGTWVSGTRRWEAAVLQVLVQDAKRGGDWVQRERLDEELKSLGQQVDLNRTQWRRLWHNLRGLFAQAGKEDAFVERFRVTPRRFTVGPWGWDIRPGDAFKMVSKAGARRARPMKQRLHALAANGTLQSSLKVIDRLGLCHALWWGSSLQAALEAFQTGTEWALATSEVLVHRALSIADMAIMTGQFELARGTLDSALTLINENETCKDQLLNWQLLEFACGEYERGIDCSFQGGTKLMRMLQLNQGAGQDHNTRAWGYAFAARGFRHKLLESAGASPWNARLERKTIEIHLASVFLAIVGANFSAVPVMLDLLLVNLALMICAGRIELIDAAIDCHQTARRWLNLHEPPDAFVWADIWMSRLRLERPTLRRRIDERVAAPGWLGPDPATPEFHRRILKRAAEGGDPVVLSRVAAISYKYFKVNDGPPERAAANKVFKQVAAAHPWVISRMARNGFGSFVPDLMRQAGYAQSAETGGQK